MAEEQLIEKPTPPVETDVVEVIDTNEALPADETEEEFVPTALPLEEAEEGEFLDPLGGDFIDPLHRGERDQVLPSKEQTAMATEIYNLAQINLGLPSLTPDAVERALMSDSPQNAIGALVSGVLREDEEVYRQAMLDIIGDPTDAVEERLKQVERLQQQRTWDVNIVQRQGLHNLNDAAYLSTDTEDAEYAHDVGAAYAESMPKDIAPVEDTDIPPAEYQRAFEVLLDHYATAADEAASYKASWDGDFAVSAAVPFRYQAPVIEIFYKLGIPAEKGFPATAAGTALMGEGLRMIREHVAKLPPKEKLQALQTIMAVVKPNPGLFGDGNDWVVSHVLHQIFNEQLSPAQAELSAYAATTSRGLTPGAAGQFAAAAGMLDRLPAAFGRQLDRFVDNTGSVLDSVGLGLLARQTLKLGAKFIPASLRRAQKVNPEMVLRTLVDALGDPEMAAKIGGMSAEEIVTTFFPSARKVLQEGGVNGFHELLARNLEIQDAAVRLGATSNLSNAERAAAWKEMQDHLGELAAQPSSTLHLDKSVVERTPTDLKIVALFGQTKERGWAYLGNARKAQLEEVKRVFGVDANVTIVAKHPKTGAFVEVGKGVPDRQLGEFYLKVEDTRAYEAAPTAFHELTFAKDDIANTLFSPGKWLNKLSLGFTNPSNIFSRNLMSQMSHVKGLQTRWSTLALDMTKKINALNGKQQKVLSDILKEGEKARTATGRGTVFSAKQLAERGADEATQLAYAQSRMMADTMYQVANRHTRTRMLQQGLQDIQGPTGRVGFGKPLRAQDAIGDMRVERGRKDLDVFNPATGEFSRMDAATISAHYEQGGQLARMETPILTKKGEALHVLVDPKAGSRVYGLPRQVLTKVEGYYPHVWEGNYVVYGTTKNGNRVALGLASNQKDAAAAVAARKTALANRKAKGKKDTHWEDFGFDFDRSLTDVGYRGMMAENMYANMGGIVFGRRNGGRLANFSKADGDVLVDPVESLLRGMEVLGQAVTKDELMHTWQQRLANTIRVEGLRLENPNALPDAVTNRIIPDSGKAEAVSKAEAALEQIEFYKRVPDVVDATLSRFFYGAANVLNQLSTMKGMSWIGSKLEKGASKLAARPPRPDAALLGFMHRYSIAGAPLRHGVLGITQSLMVAGLNPKAYLHAVSQAASVGELLMIESVRLSGMGSRGMKEMNSAYKIASKLTPGMDEKELRAFVRVLFDSGLTSSVAHHNQMRASMRSLAFDRMRKQGNKAGQTVAEKVLSGARTADEAVYGTLSKVGFEFGENMNRVIVALTQYHADKAKKVANLADPDYVRSLVGRTNELVGNMTPELGFNFQRGFFKNFTQFWGFQIKMLQLMLPEIAGGTRSLSAAEKGRLVLGQFLLFGRRGGAHIDALYRFVDGKVAEHEAEHPESNAMETWKSPAVQAAMEGLVFDWTLNQMVSALNGPNTPEFAFSEAFAPGGGTEFVVDALVDMGSLDVQKMAGLSGERASKALHFLSRVNAITLAQLEDMDDVPVDERFKELYKGAGAELFSHYNRLLQVRAAEKLDGFVSAGGYITEGYSGDLEGKLFQNFGIMTRDRAQLFEDMDKFMAKHEENPDKNLQALADEYYKDFIYTATKLDEETANRDDLFSDMLDKWQRERALVFSMLPAPEAERVHELVRERIGRLLKKQESTQHRFVDRILKDVQDLNFGPDGPSILKYLQNQPYIKNDPGLVEAIDRAFIEATTVEEE